MSDIAQIEFMLRRVRCSKELALASMLVIMIAHMNEVEAMARTGRKASSTVNPNKPPETPAEAFIRLATRRTNNAVRSIRLVGQTSGPSYESTDTQKAAIVVALKAAVEDVERSFAGSAKPSDTFTLPVK